MKYVVCRISDGEICSVGESSALPDCPPELLVVELPQGFEDISFETHRLVNGELLPYPDAVVQIKQQRPPYPAQWNNATLSWQDLRKHPDVRQGALALIRERRDQLLLESDWTDTVIAQQRLGEAKAAAWQAYRQALRDMPEQDDIFNPVWPEAPQ